MTRLCRCSILASLLATAPAQAAWMLETLTDPATDVEVRAAVGRGGSGFLLAVFREHEGGRVVGLLRMPAGRADFLAAERPPVLVLDGGTPLEPSLLDGDLKWQRFALWHGRGEPLAGLLRDWMEGASLTVRYPLYGGGYKEERFSLDGARDVIAAALGVRGEVGADELEVARKLEQARSRELERCLATTKKRENERCLTALAACGDAATTAAELEECLAASAE